MKRINRLTETDLTRIVKRVINEGKNSFDYEWGEGVYINGSMSFTIYFDKRLNRMVYKYPGKFGGNTVDGLLSNEDIDELIELLQKYKGTGY